MRKKLLLFCFCMMVVLSLNQAVAADGKNRSSNLESEKFQKSERREVHQKPIRDLYEIRIKKQNKAKLEQNDPFLASAPALPITEYVFHNIVVPVYQPEKDLLKSAFLKPGNVDLNQTMHGVSVRRQGYSEWLYKYLARPEGVPNPQVLHKWTSPIKITLGLPELGYRHGQKITTEETDQATKILIKNVTSEISNELEPLIGLPVSYVQDPRNGNVHVVPFNYIPPNGNRYKYGESIETTIPEVQGLDFRRHVAWQIDTKYKFTPDSLKQVEGYILAGADNNIEASVCFIWEGHDEKMFEALVKECVFRSLGFVNSLGYDSGFLSRWNEPGADKQNVDPPEKLSSYERFLIRLLYSENIKSGMYYRQLSNALSTIMVK